MLNISKFDQSQLFKQSQLKSLQNNSYLKDTNNENFLYIKDMFFYNETEDKVKLLNMGSGIFSSVSSTISHYVWKPTTDLNINIKKYTEDYIAMWFATIWLAKQGWNIITEYIPAKNYWNDNWIDKVLRLYVEENSNIQILYMLVSEYGVWYIENKLYKLYWSNYESDVEVPLTTIPQTSSLTPRVITGLDIPAIIVVKDDDMEQFPISMLEKIKPIVYAIDRQIVMQHKQFIQNVESFVLFKWIRRPQKILTEYDAGKKIDFSMIWRVINWDEDSSVEFIENTNSLIDKAMEENKNNILRISSITDVPPEFLWLESNDWAIGANSRTLKQGSFIKRIQGIRDLFDIYIQQILDITGTESDYTRPDVLAKSDNELVEELKTAREIKIISQLEAIKKYSWYNEEQALAEQELIKEETSENLSVTTNNESNSQTNGDTKSKENTKNNKTMTE